MLDVFKRIVFFISCLSACLWTPLKSTEVPWVVYASQEDPTDVCRCYVESMEKTFDIKELVRLIVELRDYMVSTGCYFPRLTTFLEVSRNVLTQEGLEIDDVAFDALWAEFARHDKLEGFPTQQIKHKHHHKKHKKDKEIRVNSKTAVGFIKFFAGSLLCLVPVPMVQSAGIALAVIGASEMADGAREQSDKKEWQERMDSNRRMDAALEH